MNPDMEKKIEEALNSLDGIQRAEPQPFFYTRVIGRLQRDEKGVWASTGKFLSRPLVVITGLVLVMLMNLFILFQQDTTDPGAATSSNDSAVTDNEYILASSSSFEYENLDPQ